jgi:hypothetical protein
MSFLDKKIKENKDFFDDQPLPEGHKNRFVDRLGEIKQEQVKKDRWPNLLKFAAVIIILISGYFAFRTISLSDINNQVMDQVTEISLGTELENVFAYYDALSEQKIEQIDVIARDSTQANRIKQFAQRQLQELDANLAAIEKEYAKYPENKRLKAAIINNKRKKAEIMDNILKQVDDASTQSGFTNPELKMNTNP